MCFGPKWIEIGEFIDFWKKLFKANCPIAIPDLANSSTFVLNFSIFHKLMSNRLRFNSEKKVQFILKSFMSRISIASLNLCYYICIFVAVDKSHFMVSLFCLIVRFYFDRKRTLNSKTLKLQKVQLKLICGRVCHFSSFFWWLFVESFFVNSCKV